MHLLDIVRREPRPEPWAEGDKIPWNEPGFSARMLAEHLSQEHDAASRRAEVIDRQVHWIHAQVMGGRPGRVLDLGCGPGLYTNRLAALGHTCVGIDFGPASIAYARERAAATGANCVYIEGDIRSTPFGPDRSQDLVMLIYGELNAFRRADALEILARACRALAPDGRLLLEPHTFAAVQQVGKAPATWYTSAAGLFSARPHLVLHEPFWHGEEAVAVERYYVIDAETGEVARHTSALQAYTDEGYRQLLAEAGFGRARLYPSLTGQAEPGQEGLLAIVAWR